MCHQTAALVQGALESAGMVTVSITMLREITEKVTVPRALEVPFDLGYPLGAPNRPDLQRAVLCQALELTTVREPLPVMRVFKETSS